MFTNYLIVTISEICVKCAGEGEVHRVVLLTYLVSLQAQKKPTTTHWILVIAVLILFYKYRSLL